MDDDEDALEIEEHFPHAQPCGSSRHTPSVGIASTSSAGAAFGSSISQQDFSLPHLSVPAPPVSSIPARTQNQQQQPSQQSSLQAIRQSQKQPLLLQQQQQQQQQQNLSLTSFLEDEEDVGILSLGNGGTATIGFGMRVGMGAATGGGVSGAAIMGARGGGGVAGGQVNFSFQPTFAQQQQPNNTQNPRSVSSVGGRDDRMDTTTNDSSIGSSVVVEEEEAEEEEQEEQEEQHQHGIVRRKRRVNIYGSPVMSTESGAGRSSAGGGTRDSQFGDDASGEMAPPPPRALPPPNLAMRGRPTTTNMLPPPPRSQQSESSNSDPADSRSNYVYGARGGGGRAGAGAGGGGGGGGGGFSMGGGPGGPRGPSSSSFVPPPPPSSGTISSFVDSNAPAQRRIPGPAGMLAEESVSGALANNGSSEATQLPLPVRRSVTITSSNDNDFKSRSWRLLLKEMDLPPFAPVGGSGLEISSQSPHLRYTIARVLKDGFTQKIPQMFVMIKSLQTVEDQALLVIKDPTAEMPASLHRKAIEENPREIVQGAALILRNVSIFSPNRSVHCAIITADNILRIFSPRSRPSNQVSTNAVVVPESPKRGTQGDGAVSAMRTTMKMPRTVVDGADAPHQQLFGEGENENEEGDW